MIDREALRVAILEVGMRLMVIRAGGEIIINREDYKEMAGDDKHFHFEKNGDEIRFYVVPAQGCTNPAHEFDESEKSPRLFGPGGQMLS